MDAAASLLVEALNAKPEDSEYADRIVRIWRHRPKDELASLLHQARSRWPQNTVFEVLLTQVGLVGPPRHESESALNR